MNPQSSLEEGVNKLGLTLSAYQKQCLLQYIDAIEKWNRVYNLVGRRQNRELLIRAHLLDCLATVPYIGTGALLDLGSGAGFPGIPLAIARPEISVTLLESSQKKAAFLKQVVAELRLHNAAVVIARAESWFPERRFEQIISRAFAELRCFVSLAARLLALEGELLAMKGRYPAQEIAGLPEGFRVKQVHRLKVAAWPAERHLVVIVRV